MNNQKTLSVEEASEMLGVSRTTVWKYRKEGWLSNVATHPRKVEIPLEDVTNLLLEWHKLLNNNEVDSAS